MHFVGRHWYYKPISQTIKGLNCHKKNFLINLDNSTCADDSYHQTTQLKYDMNNLALADEGHDKQHFQMCRCSTSPTSKYHFNRILKLCYQKWASQQASPVMWASCIILMSQIYLTETSNDFWRHCLTQSASVIIFISDFTSHKARPRRFYCKKIQFNSLKWNNTPNVSWLSTIYTTQTLLWSKNSVHSLVYSQSFVSLQSLSLLVSKVWPSVWLDK